jgi:glycerol-3-phosphate acyltransferase PlsY
MMAFIWLIASYFLGAAPFGLIVAKGVCGIDPRKDGSGNTGATNVARLCGTRYGVAVLVLDIVKGFAAVSVAMAVSDSAFFHGLVLLVAVAGHMYSMFLGMKGGKGVATTIGCFLALSPASLLIAVALCVLVIALSGFVSLGSLTLVTAMPLLLLLSGQFSYLIFSLLVMGLVYARHRENIARLARGEEKPWRKNENDSASQP